MSNNQINTFFLQRIEKNINENWKNKAFLQSTQDLLAKKGSELKGFNTYAAFLGLAFTHTSIIYYTKTVLSGMEKKAPQHMALCLGVGGLFGLIVGQTLGKNIQSYNYYSKLSQRVEQRIKELA